MTKIQRLMSPFEKLRGKWVKPGWTPSDTLSMTAPRKWPYCRPARVCDVDSHSLVKCFMFHVCTFFMAGRVLWMLHSLWISFNLQNCKKSIYPKPYPWPMTNAPTVSSVERYLVYCIIRESVAQSKRTVYDGNYIRLFTIIE